MANISGREFGSKTGSGFVSKQQDNVDRRERLRRLALETIDLSKDPYFMRNHLGQYECRLCLTLHKTEANYLAHTQGKRHQQNLAKRAAREAAEQAIAPAPTRRFAPKGGVKIGRPGYRVTKQYDPQLKSRSLLFQIEYPEIEQDTRPRHRFMSTYEQRKEPTDRRYQYILFGAEPYEVIAFKIPAMDVDKGQQEDRLFTHWDPDLKVYSFQVPFRPLGPGGAGGRPSMQPPPPPPPPGGMPPPPPPPI